MEFPSSFDMEKFKRTIPNKRIQDWPDKRSRKKKFDAKNELLRL